MQEISVKFNEFPTIHVSLEGIVVNTNKVITSHTELEDRTLPDQHPISSITGLEDALKNAVNDEKVSEAVESALAEAKASGEFDGADGKDGTSVTVASVSESTADGGSNVITFSDGKTLTVKNGTQGSKGDKGDPGEKGADGADGYTPQKGVDYFDGEKGDKGDKGDTGAQGIQGIQGEKGEKGDTGEDGKDYVLTDADKAELAQMAADTVNVPTALKNPNALTINGTSYDGSSAVTVDTKVVRAAFTYYKEDPVLGIERVICDITPSELVGYMSSKTVIAEITAENGTYIGSAVFGKTGLLEAVADIVTTKGIYRITAVSTNEGYSVDFLQLTASDGGIIIYEEATVSSSIVSNLAFQLDTIYDIYWNGILYTCTSFESEGEVYTGNGSIINSNLTDTGEPFLFTHLAGASSCLLHKASDQASSNTLMVATHGYKVAGDGIDVTAEVGQTIVVEEVDANGKPTKWKAADFPKILVVSPKAYDENDTPIMDHTSTEMQSAIDDGYLIFLTVSGTLCVPTSTTSGTGENFVMEFVCIRDTSIVFDVGADGSLIFA